MVTTSEYELAFGYPSDAFTATVGAPFRMIFFKHSSLAIEVAGKYIYTDPVVDHADYDSLPKADLILISHHHYDHFEIEAVYKLMKQDTLIFCDATTAGILAEHGIDCSTVRPGISIKPLPFLRLETLPAYNYSEGRTNFHPKNREDVGYIICFGGVRIYIAGDGENTPEMKAAPNIDIALLPVNQPYTMTVDQAVDAVKAIRPRIFYPYHYGQVEEQTDLQRLQRELEGICEVRIRGME